MLRPHQLGANSRTAPKFHSSVSWLLVSLRGYLSDPFSVHPPVLPFSNDPRPTYFLWPLSGIIARAKWPLPPIVDTGQSPVVVTPLSTVLFQVLFQLGGSFPPKSIPATARRVSLLHRLNTPPCSSDALARNPTTELVTNRLGASTGIPGLLFDVVVAR